MTDDEINKLALVANKIANQIDCREDHARLLDAIATLRDAALHTSQPPSEPVATIFHDAGAGAQSYYCRRHRA
jgi:hypothetical protein